MYIYVGTGKFDPALLSFKFHLFEDPFSNVYGVGIFIFLFVHITSQQA